MIRRTSAIVACAAALTLVFPLTASAAEATPVATGLEIPWGLTFLPDSSALFTQRDTGQIMSWKDGQVTEVQRIEDSQPTDGEGGLMGLAASPNFESDQTVFIFYSTAEDNRIAKLRLGEAPQPILTGIRKNQYHNGGRLAFGPDGMLYATTGDAQDPDSSQDVNSLNGKILRMTPDGAPAPGNPFGDSLVYSMGHRNPQGLAWDGAGRLFSAELGQNTWDEVNRIDAGKNYGWPVCEGQCGNDQFVDPLVTWPTAEASPSGLAIHQGAVYVAALRGQRLWQIPLNDDGTLGQPTALFQGEFGRLRTVLPAPDGTLWVTTSNRDNNGVPVPDDDRILSVTF
ncbi:PQQ-dependent sugar dehydrogenase [Saccharopolyspora sp. K220]|uniref:PQQ-dependent sugar dehydrogenase n=1 Tax=Saccharopolyspora soli TaxID=2926618 RepID=UPI001F58F922|nr:PQQ-dependent sugar dehydrogenase [Saccharopolyspora soli]MCI2421741.1 PQQ-dependent sugar dehydrogenase [Saccharopolyspora soli]